jgi:hypothetical protein
MLELGCSRVMHKAIGFLQWETPHVRFYWSGQMAGYRDGHIAVYNLPCVAPTRLRLEPH